MTVGSSNHMYRIIVFFSRSGAGNRQEPYWYLHYWWLVDCMETLATDEKAGDLTCRGFKGNSKCNKTGRKKNVISVTMMICWIYCCMVPCFANSISSALGSW